jgi:vacuolar-type H+-ATPase catalytic subunit A/Vma1
VRQVTSQAELNMPLAYIETTIPAGMTIADYRRGRPQRASWWRRISSRR